MTEPTNEETPGMSMKLTTIKRDGTEYLRLDVKHHAKVVTWEATVRPAAPEDR